VEGALAEPRCDDATIPGYGFAGNPVRAPFFKEQGAGAGVSLGSGFGG
jgi:hypothetical protein